MCGIIGLLTKESIKQSDFSSLSKLQSHRGPDANNIVFDVIGDFNLALAHQRLSIVDLVGGIQPMNDSDGEITIIFNGEIYNHQDLRVELVKKGYEFNSHHSDTEVIIYAYKEWGTSCFEKFNGMWSLALIDRKFSKVILSRDRLGKKPLYYYFKNDTLMFASELKTIRGHFGNSLSISDSSILEYLEYGYIHSPNSIYKEVSKVNPACFIEIELGNSKCTLCESNYWNFSPCEKWSDEDNWFSQLKELLKNAVKIRLSADVDVGLFLSGGVDSAVVSALASDVDSEIKAYTIGFCNTQFDELDDAKYIANLLNLKHSYEDMTELDYNLWTKIISNMDEPFADASMFPMFEVSKLASQELKVTLSGDGGDEIFFGYPRYEFTENLFKKYHVFSRVGQILTDVFPCTMRGFKFASLLKNCTSLSSAYNAVLKDPVANELVNIKSNLPNPYQKCNDIEQISFSDLSLNMSDQILTKVDRMSMLNSIEVRSPLLDYRIIEHVFSAPFKYKYKHHEKKHILKKIAVEIGIPKDYLEKKKRGFNVPLDKWIKDVIIKDVYDAKDLFFINKKLYSKIVDLSINGKRDYFTTIFRVALLYKWLKINEKN